MKYIDTRDKNVFVSFKTAVLEGMNPKTGGLYIPVSFPKLPNELLHKMPHPSLREIALETIKPYALEEMSEQDLSAIIADAYPFNAPVVPLDQISYVLELFHGPTCAFKDFGARFMARVMSYFNKDENDPLHILVATSGDTGSAVGSAFHNVSGLDVTILYPKGKISPLQEKQLSTFTGNVRSLAVEGNFDDCQKLVKTAFTDTDLRKKFRLSSANSINISRLLPQSFYYTYAALCVKQRCKIDNKIENPSIIMSVPSGNFGNITSGLIAKEMGAPITGFIAATNANNTIPEWLVTGEYKERKTIATLSNAMDVGSPSNYERIKHMYPLEQVRKLFAGFWLDDARTLQAIQTCYSKTGYILDPHGAVAYSAWEEIRKNGFNNVTGDYTKNAGLVPNIPDWEHTIAEKKAVGIILETAHPAKFGETVKQATGREPSIPDRLEKVLHLKDRSINMNADYNEFKSWLLHNL